MSRVIVKRRISLDFLGEEYKECYLEFKAIPVSQWKEYKNRIYDKKYSDISKKIKDEQELSDSERKYFEEKDEMVFDEIVDVLKDRFLSGKYIDQDGKLFEVEKEEVGDFDSDTLINAFDIITGKSTLPKVPESS